MTNENTPFDSHEREYTGTVSQPHASDLECTSPQEAVDLYITARQNDQYRSGAQKDVGLFTDGVFTAMWTRNRGCDCVTVTFCKGARTHKIS